MLINIKRTQSVFQLDYLTFIVLSPLLFKNILTLKTSVCFPQSFILALYILHARRRRWHPTPVLLPGKSHGWRSLEGCSPWGRWGSDMTERLHFHFSFSCIGEGNGNPLQCSCLENPRDGGAWRAPIYRVAQSRTQLKWLSSSSSSILHANKPFWAIVGERQTWFKMIRGHWKVSVATDKTEEAGVHVVSRAYRCSQGLNSLISMESHGGNDSYSFFRRLVIQSSSTKNRGPSRSCSSITRHGQRFSKIWRKESHSGPFLFQVLK